MKTINLADFRKTLQAQGVPHEHFAFRCPMCDTVQSARDLIDAEAGADFEGVEQYLGFSCVGRWHGAGAVSDEKGQGCNWTLGGLFKAHTLEVIDSLGNRQPRFEPVSAEEAQAHKDRFTHTPGAKVKADGAILPVAVQRDQCGHWTHPAWPVQGNQDIPKSWLKDNGLDLVIVEFEHDAPEELAKSYYHNGDPEDRSDWTPSKPEGEGWFVFSIHDTEDGPVCVWVRKLESATEQH